MSVGDTGPAAEPLCNIDAEQSVLGCLLMDNGALERLPEQLLPQHFYEPFHARLFAAISESILKGVLAEPIILLDRFRSDAAFVELGGLEYLADLVDRAPPSHNIAGYGVSIHDLAQRRAIRRLAREIDSRTMDVVDADTVLGELERGAAEIAQANTSSDKWIVGGAMVRTAVANAQKRRGVMEFPSGIQSLDDKLGGLHPGEMTILAARPGVGKTVGAQMYARAVAAAGRGVVFFSLEMDADPMGLRLACDLAYERTALSYSGITSNPTMEKANKNTLDAHQWDALDEAATVVDGWPILFDVRPGLTTVQIEAASRRAFRRWERNGVKPGLIVVDHLGKIRPSKERNGSRTAEVADVSGELAAMAKRLGVPVLALCQLNRGVEGRDDKRPILSDLRQAGELEEDARQVVFLHRPEYYLREPFGNESAADRVERLEKLEDARNKLFWVIEKNSHGPRGQVLTFCEIGCSVVREWIT